MADTPLEESNLALIGSDFDKAAREAAAKLEVNWEGVGQVAGELDIWRVENKRTASGTPDFGIERWPKEQYGEFFQGDSYIVLKTTKAEGSEKLLWDIFFWIGSKSSQDEYGVAAYKANELDNLLGDAPVQHRETEGYESEDFLSCFPGGVKYIEGGIDSGFRVVGNSVTPEVALPTRLFQVRKNDGSKIARLFMVAPTASSLNQGDAFILDAGTTVYTWYGDECNPFERQKAIQTATHLVESRQGNKAVLIQDVGSSGDMTSFWELLGGEGEIAPASAVTDADVPDENASKMYTLAEDSSDGRLVVTIVNPPSQDALSSSGVAMIDVGPEIFIWVGGKSSQREHSQAMTLVAVYLKNWGREKNTRVNRILEGQEDRCKGWATAF